jgi:hypothetical protein
LTDAPRTDEDFLTLCQAMRAQSVGFDHNAELSGARERALNYIKGEMPDLPVMDNRSKAVSLDVSDAIETALPDLVEIFTGGDDVAVFQPMRPDDEDAAQQETDYLNHVFFQENNGFLNLYTLIKDALQLKVGVGYVYWHEETEEDEETFEGKTAAELMLASKDGEITNVVPAEAEQGQEPLYAFTLTRRKNYSCAKVTTVPPEDFTVSPDTVDIADAPYCAMRTRPRAQDLLADGVDEEIVKDLPAYGSPRNSSVEQARDTAAEGTEALTGSGEPDDTRIVEVIDHYVRLRDGDEIAIWHIRTGDEESVLIDKTKVERIPFAAGSPYPVTHRFYGLSMADLLLEVQKIKTVLTRATLDSAYFALNQRIAVADSLANEFTISDVLNNVPGMPIRMKSPDAITPVPSPGLGFDAFNALEYFSTVAEQRTGIVRNAQGLNPDTLHDTASGALALMGNAQKRLRLIARVLGETCIKPLFLLLHAVLRENASESKIVRLDGKWVPVDPSTWAERNDMTIEIGLGSAGRQHDIDGLMKVGAMAGELGKTPYGAQIVTAENAYNIVSTTTKKLGFKQPERFFTDPSTQPPPPPQQSPEIMKVQADAAAQQARLSAEMQLEQVKVASNEKIEAAKAQSQAAVNTQQQALEHQRLLAKQQGEMAMEQMKIASQERIAIEVARIKAEAQIAAAGLVAKSQQGNEAEEEGYQRSHETGTA